MTEYVHIKLCFHYPIPSKVPLQQGHIHILKPFFKQLFINFIFIQTRCTETYTLLFQERKSAEKRKQAEL